jgi:hypothetical protein
MILALSGRGEARNVASARSALQMNIMVEDIYEAGFTGGLECNTAWNDWPTSYTAEQSYVWRQGWLDGRDVVVHQFIAEDKAA